MINQSLLSGNSIPTEIGRPLKAIQPKLRLNNPGDRYEQEADAMAGRVMRMAAPGAEATPVTGLIGRSVQRKCTNCDEENKRRGTVMRKAASGNDSTNVSPAFSSALHATRGGGSPLPEGTRNFMENAFSADFSGVRVHADSRAAEMNRGIHARAFTYGSDIYFGQETKNLHSESGKRLLAHELTHVQQQEGTDHSGILSRDVLTGPTNSTEILAEINHRLDTNNHMMITELVRNLILMMSTEDMLTQGVPLVIRLLEAQFRTEAISVLNAVSSAWMQRFATNSTLVNLCFTPDHPIEALLNRANVEESRGDHATVIDLLKNAFYLSQILLLHMTSDFDTRMSEAVRGFGRENADSVNFGILHILMYMSYAQLYQAIRGIVTFYIVRQRQAMLAGNTQAATQYGILDGQLDTALHDSAILLSGSTGRGLTITTTVPTAANPNPVLQGNNGVSESIRPLPGAPRPDEIAEHPYYSIEMPRLLDTLRGQEQLVNEVFQFPEVVAAFPGQSVNWNSRDERARLWIAVYDGLQRQHGTANALPALLGIIQRYLENYTFHTEYDIRDFGTSYLASDFPTDLIGRVARDCGVYAVMTAYEIYRVAHHATLNLHFSIYTSLDHVILAMIEPALNRHFVLSNNQISAPISGIQDADIIQSVGTCFAAIGQTRYGVTPVMHNEAGDSSMGERRFSTQLWNQFREIGHTWGLRDRSVVNPASHQQESLYDRHYRDLRTFNSNAALTFQSINSIEQHLTTAASTADQLLIFQREFIPLADDVIRQVWPAFMRLGECADIATTSRSLAGRHREFVYNAGPTLHPLVQTAIMLLRFQSTGGTLTNEQLFFICSLQRIPKFGSDIQSCGYPVPACPASFEQDYHDLCTRLTAS